MHPRLTIEEVGDGTVPPRLNLRLDGAIIHYAMRSPLGGWDVREHNGRRLLVGNVPGPQTARQLLERLAECEEEYLDT